MHVGQGKFVYELPENVVEVHEVFLDDALQLKDSWKNGQLHAFFGGRDEQSERTDAECRRPDWEILFRLYHDQNESYVFFEEVRNF